MEMPQKVGPFEVLRELGRGGMGGVFLAEDPRLGRKVALKILLPARQEGSEGTARLLKEAKAAAKLEHPNVCAIYEVGESDSGAYIAMQYVEGETIDAVLSRSRPSLREVVSWGVQIADALSEAHRLGIIHRDIKPQNLMVTPKGQVKVLDFGLAKIVPHGPHFASTSTLLTQEGVVMGTVPYMSPEQVRNDVLDGRSDLFSLGSVLFEAATGRRPFPAANSAELMSEILLKDPFWDGAGDHLPPELHAVLAMALQKKKADRYTSAEAMAADLRAVLGSIQGSAGVPGGPFHAWSSASGARSGPLSLSGDALTAAVSSSRALPATPLPRPWWRAPFFLAGLGLAIAGPAAYFAVPKLLAQQRAIDSIAVLPFTAANGDAEAEALGEGLTEQLINQLARIPNLKVIARSSVLRYKGATPDLKALAKELGVQAVLLGRLEKKGERLTLSAEVVEIATQRQLLGETYTGTTLDILAMQDRLMRDLGRKSLTPLLAAKQVTPKVSGEAFDLYLRAKKAMGTFTLEGIQQAFGFLDEALRLSPGFAQAQSAKAYGYMLLGNQYMSSLESRPKLQAAAEKALELDPENAEAHTLLALSLANSDFDFKGAEQQFRRALELAPGSARTHELYGYFLTAMGRKEDAARELDKALDLDPLSASLHCTKAVSCVMARDWEGAKKFAEKAQKLEPGNSFPNLALSRVHSSRGDWVSALKTLPETYGNSTGVAQAFRAVYMGRLGRTQEAISIAEKFSGLNTDQNIPKSHYSAAAIYLAVGDKIKTIEQLKLAVQLRESPVLFLGLDPFFDETKNDPSFKEILKGISLNQSHL